ncbi:hypothetical protein BDR03DRAFT_1070606 [Suillus americanus]|nr:hypothetical protein BDR03DRAFT_1070606 [Suillus americanus]
MRYTQLLDLLMEKQMTKNQRRSGKTSMIQRVLIQKICKSFPSLLLLITMPISTISLFVSQSMPVHLALLLFTTPFIRPLLKYERQSTSQMDLVFSNINGMMMSILHMK